jgi:hypothetical protein
LFQLLAFETLGPFDASAIDFVNSEGRRLLCALSDDARKESKYAIVEQSYLFQPLAFETVGPLDASAIDFINSKGRRLCALSDDSGEASLLFQRLSI